jgi:hypothetical protein
MRTKAWWLAPLVCLTLIGGAISTPARAQSSGPYFDETKHSVTGEMLTFYQSIRDVTLVLGYPITDLFTDNMGTQVQYFQKGRLEYNPDAPEGKRVKMTDLGTLILQPARLIPVTDFSTNTPACTPYTSQFGTFYVCYAFQGFFNKHGGLAQFGYPLTNYSKEGDLYVQYFERARFEYHPGPSIDSYVRLTNIGKLQFDSSGNDPIYLLPVAPHNYQPKVIRLHAQAFVGHAVLRAQSSQSLYVVVMDQGSDPVPNAAVRAFVILPDGRQLSYSLPATDEDGISQLKFDIGAQLPNQVNLIRIEITYEGLKTSTTTWFRTWW